MTTTRDFHLGDILSVTIGRIPVIVPTDSGK